MLPLLVCGSSPHRDRELPRSRQPGMSADPVSVEAQQAHTGA